jgi:hypothetical protein
MRDKQDIQVGEYYRTQLKRSWKVATMQSPSLRYVSYPSFFNRYAFYYEIQ